MSQVNESQSTVQTNQPSPTELAKACDWNLAKKLFINEVASVVSVAHSSLSSKDWTGLRDVELTVTLNNYNNKYCIWEYGGAKASFGSAVVIGTPDGKAPIPMAAFRKCVPNGTQAAIQIWPGCIVAIATQSRGIGCVLLYRIASVNVKSETNPDTDDPMYCFKAKLELNKVIDMSENRTIFVKNDLRTINVNSRIVKQAIYKATIFNCEQAIYIRRFFHLNDGYKLWDINTVDSTNEYTDEPAVLNYLTDIMNKISFMVRKMPNKVYPFVGIKLLEKIEENVVIDESGNGEPGKNIFNMKIKFAVFTDNKSFASILVLNENLFYKFRDMFKARNWEDFISKIDSDDELSKIQISKYVGN